MLPSSTVENYLKAIYQGQSALSAPGRLVPMGQVANALGVTPGTATTMVKALSEAGLVEYEPYSGVRLSPSGEKLAVLVLRRHRLVELFLVQVMGMSWAEVHDEAELLEHVVSERLIERMDEMLGRPTHDPHGDPIPTSEGTIAAHPLESLLTCPVGRALTVTRIADQDPAFLRFIEENALKPGAAIEVESRDPAADAVKVGRANGTPLTIGTRAASKLMVKVVAVVVALSLTCSAASAQTPSSTSSRPWEITDNSFFVEEAFNQEPGIFQNILGWTRGQHGEWSASFTQEWPAPSMKHQLSYTVPFQGGGGDSNSLGQVLLNYRFQALEEAPGRPAFSPRISVMLHNGPGLQFNLPFSQQAGDFYFHWNAGMTWVRADPPGRSTSTNLTSPAVAGSVIWRTWPMLNLMFESVFSSEEFVDEAGVGREGTATLSPGFRGGWNIGEQQLIVGAAVPVTRAAGETDVAGLLYFSYELPFLKR